MRKPFLAALILPLLTTACAVGPDYRPPAPPPPAMTGAFVSSARGTASSAAQDQWWRLYDDPALDRLIARAFAANTDLRVAVANLARAQAVLREAWGSRLPATSVRGGVTYGDGMAGSGAQAIGSDARWSISAGLGVAWEVDLFGRIRRTIEAARTDADAEAAARDRVAVIVAAETARAYVDACALGNAEATARQSIAIAEQGLALVEAKARAGSAMQFDVERSASALAQARATLPPIVGQRQARLFELAALTGAPPADVPEDARTCTRPPEPIAAIPVGDGAALLPRRPDVREAERRLAAQTARIGIATADLYPRISLGGSGNFFRSDQMKGSDMLSFSVGPMLSWSIPNIAVARARIAQADAGAQAAFATFDGAVLTALKETEQALAAYDAQQRRTDDLRDATERAKNAYALADQRYRAGAISFLDLLDSQRELVASRLALSEAMLTLGSARIDLFKALGGGWGSGGIAGGG
jgi:NodT family efflux transporter outer membrane factor (OMF) lipoprotein